MLARMHRFAPLVLALACGGQSQTQSQSQSSSATSTTEDAGTATATPTSSGSTAAADSSSGEPTCDTSADAVADCIEPERYAADLELIADIRTPGSAHWQAVQELCFDRLTEWGYDVELDDYGEGVNVIGRKAGATAPDEIVMIGAHYDHIADCLGADDNATGVSAALEIARVLAIPTFDRSIMIACWDQEELGLLGSRAFATAAAAEGLDIVVDFNFDMIGFKSDEPDTQMIPPGLDAAFPDTYAEIEANGFRGDFITIMADFRSATPAADFIAQAERLGLPTALLALPEGTETSALFSDLRRSDHASFWDEGYAAIFLTDTANFRNEHYHCENGPDVIADLDQDFAVAVARATAGAAASTAGL
jgi:hypothetical protein